jgi:hypothetical protein
MASRRVVCPRCHYLVGVPALQPTLAGGLGPMSPGERVRHALNRANLPQGSAAATLPLPATLPKVVEPRLVRLLSRKKERPLDPIERHLEEHWYQCLEYPLRAWPLCLGLAVIMTLLSAGIAAWLPSVLAEPPAGAWARALLRGAWGLLLTLFVGIPCSFLECVLASASEGEIYYIRWSGSLLLTIVTSGLRWFACFLAGPVLFAVTASLYWFYCGEPSVVDWLILAELAVVAIAYQAFALLAITDRGRLRDLNPLAVIDLAHRLGRAGLLTTLGAAGLCLAHGVAAIAGVIEFHGSVMTGLAILAGVWISGVFLGTFFFRLLGVWCYRSRRTATVSHAVPQSG